MTVDLVLSFNNEQAYKTALDILAGMGAQIRRTSDMFFTISITVPDEMYAVVRGFQGIANIVKDITMRPACCDLDKTGFYPEAEAGAGYTWEDFTVKEPAALEYMKVPKGLTGKCVRVAVLDTGIDSTHPALRGAVAQKVQITDGNIEDAIGHGTHVSGTIAGREVDSPLGRWRGIAPGARLININVLDSKGNGKLSDLIAGLEAAVKAKAQLVNMSLGAPLDFLADPLASAVEALTQNGILVVCAAGNNGPAPMSVGIPGTSPGAVTVAAASIPIEGYIKGGETAEFSSRGPALRSGWKPDITAPGGAGGLTQKAELIYGPSTGILDAMIDGQVDEWAGLRGTSMACPHITGLLALLMEKYKFDRYQLNEAFSATARRHSSYRDFDQGWGLVDGQALADYFEQRRLYR